MAVRGSIGTAQLRLQPLVSAPLGSPDWKSKLDEMVVRRALLFERAMPFKNAADVHRHRSVFLRKDYETMRTAERDALEAALPAALRKNREFFEALDQALSFGAWQHLRRDQKLTQDQARQTVQYAVRALAGASGK